MLHETNNSDGGDQFSQSLRGGLNLYLDCPEILACEVLTKTDFSPHLAVLAERLQLSLLYGTAEARDIILSLGDEAQQIQFAGYLEPEDIVGLAFLFVEDQQGENDTVLHNRIATICSHTSKLFTEFSSSEAVLVYLEEMLDNLCRGISKKEIGTHIRAYASAEDPRDKARIVSDFVRPYLTGQKNTVATFDEAQRWVEQSTSSLKTFQRSSVKTVEPESNAHTYETFLRRLSYFSRDFILPEAETEFLVRRPEIIIAPTYFDLYNVSEKDGKLESEYFVPLRSTDTLIAFDLTGSKALQQANKVADVTHLISWAGMAAVLIELELLQKKDFVVSEGGLHIECGDSVAHVAGDGGWVIASTPEAVTRWTEILKTVQVILQVHPSFSHTPLWMRGYRVPVSEIGQQVYIGAFEGPLRDANGTRQVQYALGGPALARLEDYIKRLACPAPWILPQIDLTEEKWDPYIIDYRVITEVDETGVFRVRLAKEEEIQKTLDQVLGIGGERTVVRVQQFALKLDFSRVPPLIEQRKEVGAYEPGSYIVLSPNMAGRSVQSAPQNRFVADIKNWRSLIEIFRKANVAVIGQVDEPGISRLMVLYPPTMSEGAKYALYGAIYNKARSEGVYLFLGGISSGTSNSVTFFKSPTGHLIQMVAPGPAWLFSAAAGAQDMELKYGNYVREKLTLLRTLSEDFRVNLPDPEDDDVMAERFPGDREVNEYRKAFILLRSIYLSDQAFRKTLVPMSSAFQLRAEKGYAYWLEQLGIDPQFLGLERTGRSENSFLISAEHSFFLPERSRPFHYRRQSHLRH